MIRGPASSVSDGLPRDVLKLGARNWKTYQMVLMVAYQRVPGQATFEFQLLVAVLH